MADLVEQLRAIARNPSDPRRGKAVQLLHRRGESVAGGPLRDVLQQKVAQSQERTDRLASESSVPARLGGAIADTFTDEELSDRVMTGLRRFANSATFGVAGKLADSVDPAGERRAQERERLYGDSPLTKVAGAAGYLTGGPLAVGKAAGAAVKPLAALGTAGRVLAAPTEGALAGGAIAGTESAVEGNDWEQIKEDATGGAIGGAVVGTALRGLGAGAGKLSQKIRDSRTQLGQWIREREAAKDFLRSRQDLPRGRGRGTTQVADEEFQGLKARSEERLGNASKAYDDLATEFLASAEGGNVAAVRGQVAKVRSANVSNGVVVDDALDRALAKVDDLLQPKEFGGQTDIKSVLTARNLAQKKARFAHKGDVTEEMETWREVYHRLNDAIDQIDPTGAFAEARAGYRAAMEQERQINAILTGKGKESLVDAAGNPMTEAGRLKAMATAQGVGAPARLAGELQSLEPGAAESMRRIAGANADDALSFSGIPDRFSLSGVAKQFGRAGAAKVIDPVAQRMSQAIPENMSRLMGPASQAGKAAFSEDVYATEPPPPQLPPNYSELPLPEKLRAAQTYSREKQRHASQRLLKKRPKRERREEFAGQTVDPITGDPVE